MNYIFDLDDTIINNSDVAYQAVNQFLKEFITRRKRKGLTLTSGTGYGRMKDRYAYYHFLKTKEYMEKGLIELAPGVKEFLESNQAVNAALTNAPYRSTHYKLEKLGLEGLVNPVITPREMERKPHPQGIEKIIQDSGYKKESFVYVGDSIKDLIAGKRAGVRTVLISNEFKRFLADEHYPTFQRFVAEHEVL